MLKQAIIPISILAILASIVLPLPAYVLDFLLVANLVLALILLITTLYVSEPLRLSSLPTILLLATLFRLALNISTTRLILSEGEAGQTVEAFGSIVIQDNLVVGVVIFVIITMVQFLVIAKGSERVAEVSARFSLDAMPGKQMSIDADVRAGLIDFDTARRKRQELQTESRFYGALDGAMKFVKGDALAGMLICVINIIGGLAIGLISQGMDLQQAVSKYSILTVGDGLVSQIPALLNALSAGLVVTRVARGDETSLSSEVLTQLGQVKIAKVLISGLCLFLAFLPGAPLVPLIFMATVLFLSLQNKAVKSKTQPVFNAPSVFQPRTPPLVQIQITKDMANLLAKISDLPEKIDIFRQKVFEQYGLILQRPDLASLQSGGFNYKILMRGVSIQDGSCNTSIGADGKAALQQIIQELSTLIEERAPEIVDDILTRRMLDYFDKEYPELVSSVVPTIINITQLTFIIKSLISEKISVKNFDLILQSIAETGGKGQGERFILEEVRIGLRRIISEAYKTSGMKTYSLDPIIDLAFARAERSNQSPDAEYVALISDYLSEQSHNAILITSRAARKLIKENLQARGLQIEVIAFDEITPNVSVTWLGNIELKDEKLQERVLQQLAA